MSLLEETKGVLRRYGLRPRGRLGQNFIVDEGALERQVGYADLGPRDTVLEIGPGIGTLTALLLEKAGKVYALEKDRRMVGVLRERFKGVENLVLVAEDALEAELPPMTKVVSNIPYSISSPLTFKLLRHGFERAILTYQLEFAARMVALPGDRDYSRLSLAVYYYARARVLEVLPPRAFYPKPKVESAVVELVPKPRPFQVDEGFFFKAATGLFVHRRKVVRKALLHSLEMILERPLEKVERRGIIGRIEGLPKDLLERRVYELTPEEVADIARALQGL